LVFEEPVLSASVTAGMTRVVQQIAALRTQRTFAAWSRSSGLTETAAAPCLQQ
jgi:hypothetical protein